LVQKDNEAFKHVAEFVTEIEAFFEAETPHLVLQLHICINKIW